ncbi:hypothetical protein XFUD_06855 [Xylella fastidiosa]|nr:hypothetical protein XFUD_06855 [Xylella fastidiosa]ARO68761.1 hypothetical protein B9J09_06760 [Xylella fastidiosa subsp. pauca]ETE31787.1 hypothetical protein B398_06905 [Xylella fastidiosa 32]OCA57903.1 hypothetical protein AA93_06775 [Xylella fastidiosa subsp. pauca 11399]OJZ70603.1 hypothetical protein B375_0206040 [Xylella fastidiosa 6c]
MDIEEIIKEAFPYFNTMKVILYDNLFSHHGKSFLPVAPRPPTMSPMSGGILFVKYRRMSETTSITPSFFKSAPVLIIG